MSDINWTKIIVVSGVVGLLVSYGFYSTYLESSRTIPYTPQPAERPPTPIPPPPEDTVGKEIVEEMNNQTKENPNELEKSVILDEEQI